MQNTMVTVFTLKNRLPKYRTFCKHMHIFNTELYGKSIPNIYHGINMVLRVHKYGSTAVFILAQAYFPLTI